MKNIFRTYHYLILFITLISSVEALAQEVNIIANDNQTLELTASHLLSDQTIQWQTSNDNNNWDDISGATTNNYIITLTNLPKYFRAKIESPECDSFYSDFLFVDKSDKLLWSDPNTWGDAGKPEAGDRVVIPKDKHIYLDEDTPELGELVILGTLEFEPQDLSLTAENILVNGGELLIGSEANPFINKAVITLNDTDLEHNLMGMMGTRGIVVVRGGKLELHAKSPDIAWTKINNHAEDGATKLTLAEQANWKTGDQIVVGPTDFYEAANGKSISQRIAITNVNEKEITLDKGIEAFHWGKLQYATTNGMSLVEENIVPTPTGDFLYGLTPDNPKVLDQRAPVGNLTRNIVIQSPNDDAWKNEGFGVHIMIMPSAVAHLDGVEIKRGGQRGRVRRYPFHWHMLSYRGSENLGDATGQYIKNSTVNVSMNRGIVVHGTNGTLVKNNIVYDVKGHGIFTEDAAERRNTFDGNFVLKVRNPEKQFAIKKHELAGHKKGSSGFWISNPDNTTINNHVADSEGNGYWLAFPDRPFGSSAGALYEDGEVMNPGKMQFGVFDYNTAHSCKHNALHADEPEIDEEGNTSSSQYTQERSGRPGNYNGLDRSSWVRFEIKRFSGWKSAHSVWDRTNFGTTLEAVASDNFETSFSGGGDRGLILGCLAVGRSLNFKKNESNLNNKHIYNAFASYHHTFDVQGNIAINFPATLNKRSGVFGMFDYYIRPVEKGHWLSIGNILINSHPGVKITANESEIGWQIGGETPHLSFSGATWDLHGYWGPKENYLVYDRPFYYGNDQVGVEVLAPWNRELNGGVSVPGPFYGINNANIKAENGTSQNRTDMVFTRYDDDLNVVDEIKLYEGSDGIQHFKHFAAQKGGLFEVSYPTLDKVYDLVFEVDNFISTEDEVVLAVEFTGDKNATVASYDRMFTVDVNAPLVAYKKVATLNEVKESNVEAYWQDKTNDKVWMKIKGGVTDRPLDLTGQWDPFIYQNFLIRVKEE